MYNLLELSNGVDGAIRWHWYTKITRYFIGDWSVALLIGPRNLSLFPQFFFLILHANHVVYESKMNHNSSILMFLLFSFCLMKTFVEEIIENI